MPNHTATPRDISQKICIFGTRKYEKSHHVIHTPHGLYRKSSWVEAACSLRTFATFKATISPWSLRRARKTTPFVPSATCEIVPQKCYLCGIRLGSLPGFRKCACYKYFWSMCKEDINIDTTQNDVRKRILQHDLCETWMSLFLYWNRVSERTAWRWSIMVV